MMIYIDPRSNIVYASMYIEGLMNVFGRKNVKFILKPFKHLSQDSPEEDFDQYFAFISTNPNRKVIIDFRDKSSINTKALEWCDVYGKVNFNLKNIPLINKVKIIPIGPNFGIRIRSALSGYLLMISNYIKSGNDLGVSFRNFMSSYNWMVKRENLLTYRHGASTDSVFFISTLYNENNEYSMLTNKYRATYIRACKKSPLKFEGGLLAHNNHPELHLYKDVITNSYIKHKQYLSLIKKSAFVFNTPSLWDCHGWKLGEFLSMGKAIISTPLSNEMPNPLQHRKNIYIINSIDEIENAVYEISNDKGLLNNMERNARAYYNEYLEPANIIRKLCFSELCNKYSQ